MRTRAHATHPSISAHPLFWFVLWSLAWALGLGLALGSFGCTHMVGTANNSGTRMGVSSASVVTLLRVKHAEPCAEEDCRLTDTWEPACTAFALRGKSGVLLVTAAHCALGALGVEFRYYAPDGVGHDRALLVARDAAHDVAVLEPRDPGSLVPLARAPVPAEGERVLSVSAVYDTSSSGALAADLGEGYYETTQTIVYGWSGSPVLDGTGRAWGVVSKCPTLLGANQCQVGHTIVASLGAL